MTKKKETAAGILRKPGGEKKHALIRVEKDWERRTNESGLGTTPPAEALYQKYQGQLETLIRANMIDGRHSRDVWDAMTGLTVEDIAERLLKLGLTVACASSLGVKRKGDNKSVKTPRNVVLWLGDKLSQLQQRDTVVEARIGGWGVGLLLRFVDLFTLDDDDVLILAPSVRRFFKGMAERAAHNNPYLLPSTKRLAPWTGVRQGPLGSRIPLVSRRYSEAAVQQAIEAGEMRTVLGAVNAIQDVWWVINEPILNVAKQLSPEIPPPPKKKGLAPSELARLCRARTKARDYHFDLGLAEIVADNGPFNVPHNMDFRGRVYGIPHFNYQRADHIRGLFLFAKGERLGDDGLPWLKYHLAGCADGNTWPWSDNRKPSKLGFDDRIAWTDRNLEQLCKIADNVLNRIVPERRWLPDDKIQFLAACVELKQALDTNPVSDFETRLPIKFDGCCSGLQHFCGLMRDPQGRLAGLTPSEVAEDFYTEVVKRLRNYPGIRRRRPLSKAALEDKIVQAAVAAILDGRDDRTIVKPPTQIYFYGASPKTMGEEIKEVLDDLGREADPEQIKKLASAIYKICGDLAPAARKVRKFVGRLAKLYADEGLALYWPPPDFRSRFDRPGAAMGFPVVNQYHLPDIRTGFAVRLGWKRIDMNLTIGDLPEMDVRKSQQSAAANLIHFFDAAHQHEIVWVASKYGIRMATVHDCFACLAPRAGPPTININALDTAPKLFWTKLNYIIRDRFISLHSISFLMLRDMLAAAKRDLAVSLMLGVELPELPMNHGPDYLNLVQVHESWRGWA
jgi:DNA-directed RNA polymerase